MTVAIVAGRMFAEFGGVLITLALIAIDLFLWSRISRVVTQKLLARAFRRYSVAFQQGDLLRAKRILDWVSPAFRSPAGKANLEMMETFLPLIEERWSEARAGMLAIDRTRYTVQPLATLDNNVAWCLAHEGRAEEAIVLVRSAIDHTDESMLGNCLGTLGAAQQLAGQPNEALIALDRALSKAATPYEQAIRQFYRGESLRALGRTDEALQAYSESARVAPRTPFGKRAQARLQSMSRQPYR
jgi:tetratricopeptide (TPR) repeat protein